MTFTVVARERDTGLLGIAHSTSPVRPHNPSMPGWRDWLAAQGKPFRE